MKRFTAADMERHRQTRRQEQLADVNRLTAYHWETGLTQQERAKLSAVTAEWISLGPAIQAVDHFAAVDPGNRPTIDALIREAKLRKLKRERGPNRRGCPNCRGDHWLTINADTIDSFPPDVQRLHRRHVAEGATFVTPCPLCLPATAEGHSMGEFEPSR